MAHLGVLAVQAEIAQAHELETGSRLARLMSGGVAVRRRQPVDKIRLVSIGGSPCFGGFFIGGKAVQCFTVKSTCGGAEFLLVRPQGSTGACAKEVGLTAGQDYGKLAKTDINWLNEVFTKFAPLQSYDLQISGANERTNYYVSGGYYDQKGTTSDSDFSRYNFRANLETKANDWLKFGTNTMFAYENYSESMSGEYALNTPISAARFMLPYWNPYRADGSLASVNDGSWKGLGQNPLEWAKTNPYITKKYKLISSLFLDITPVKGLTIHSQGGVDFSHAAVKTTVLPSYKPNNGQGKASRSSSDALNLTIFNTVSYAFDLTGQTLNIMAGQEGILYKADGFSVSTAGQTNDYLLDVSSATRATSWSSSTTAYSYLLLSAKS